MADKRGSSLQGWVYQSSMSEVAVSTELLPSQGAVVQCRSHQWLVEEVELAKRPDGDTVGQRGFDDPQVFGSCLNALRWDCVTSTDQVLFQAPLRAGIGVKQIPARAPWKDDRGRADHAQSATKAEGASGDGGAALVGTAVEGGDGERLRPELCRDRSPVNLRAAPAEKTKRQF